MIDEKQTQELRSDCGDCFHRPPQKLTPLGVMEAELRTLLEPLDAIYCFDIRRVLGGGGRLNWATMMPRDARLSAVLRMIVAEMPSPGRR